MKHELRTSKYRAIPKSHLSFGPNIPQTHPFPTIILIIPKLRVSENMLFTGKTSVVPLATY